MSPERPERVVIYDYTMCGTDRYWELIKNIVCVPVLRIRDVYPGSRIRLFSIPDPGSELSPSRICIKEFKYVNPQKNGF
jgi:hypothetical protein